MHLDLTDNQRISFSSSSEYESHLRAKKSVALPANSIFKRVSSTISGSGASTSITFDNISKPYLIAVAATYPLSISLDVGTSVHAQHYIRGDSMLYVTNEPTSALSGMTLYNLEPNLSNPVSVLVAGLSS